MTANLVPYGWHPFFASHFNSHLTTEVGGAMLPARVVREQRGVLRLETAAGAVDAVLSGRLRHLAEGAHELPVIGDWVVCRRPEEDGTALVDAVLPRRSKLSRKAAGKRSVEQLLAANVDTIFVVMGLDGDFNLRRLERYLVMCGESGAAPVVVLSKADLCADVEGMKAAVAVVALEVPVLEVAALAGDLGDLRSHLAPGRTVAVVGSSGAGKSTLINCLAGRELLRTGAVRASDHRGQHTTTHRELLRLPDGALLIDSPGLRELQPWGADEGLEGIFKDVLELAARCRFRDCSHGEEPGCAVAAAIEAGELDAARLAGYRALQREAEALAARRDVRSQRARDKRLGRLYKRIQRETRERKG
jgi:ribosome biogenesis GTPase